MQKFLNAEEILELVTTGKVTLSENLILRMESAEETNHNASNKVVQESYEQSDWYNDPNNVMSRHHY